MKKEHDLHCREARKTGGGKAPASPSEVTKLLADVIPASVNPLEHEFDDDAGEELDLRWHEDEMEAITCKVGPSLLAVGEASSTEGAAKVTKKENSQNYNYYNFYWLLNFFNDNSSHNLQLLIIR